MKFLIISAMFFLTSLSLQRLKNYKIKSRYELYKAVHSHEFYVLHLACYLTTYFQTLVDHHLYPSNVLSI